MRTLAGRQQQSPKGEATELGGVVGAAVVCHCEEERQEGTRTNSLAPQKCWDGAHPGARDARRPDTWLEWPEVPRQKCAFPVNSLFFFSVRCPMQ